MLYYMPQIWTSDDTDAIERLDIQYGVSLVYPAVSMGCHVSAVPNHQVGRRTPLQTRGTAAMAGALGYELNLLKLDQAEKQEIREQIQFYKEIRSIVQEGTLFRLREEENARAWMYVSADRRRALVSYIQVLARVNTLPKRLRLAGLERNSVYQVYCKNRNSDGETPVLRRGSTLMEIGLALRKEKEDFMACQWVVEKQDCSMLS